VLCSVLCVVLCSVLCCVLLGGRFWRSIWPLGGSFWPLGGSFWPLGASFWPLGGSFLASWKPLGASWVVGVVLRSTGPARHPTWGGSRDPKWHPKWDQKRTKDEQKRKSKTKTKKEALEDHLGAILGRSGVVLGPTWTSKSCCGCSGARFFEKSTFGENEASRGDLGRFWADLGRPGGSKMGPKWAPRRV